MSIPSAITKTVSFDQPHKYFVLFNILEQNILKTTLVSPSVLICYKMQYFFRPDEAMLKIL